MLPLYNVTSILNGFICHSVHTLAISVHVRKTATPYTHGKVHFVNKYFRPSSGGRILHGCYFLMTMNSFYIGKHYGQKGVGGVTLLTFT